MRPTALCAVGALA